METKNKHDHDKNGTPVDAMKYRSMIEEREVKNRLPFRAHWRTHSKGAKLDQNRNDLPRDTPIDRIEVLSITLRDIKNYLKNGKLEQVIAIIKSCTPNALGDLSITLKNLSVFSPKPSMHYLNITMRNVVKVFYKDTVPGNGNGVGGSGMSDKEEIIKLLEEEDIVEMELQDCRNVSSEKHQLRLDEKALIIAL
ncbi:reverse transcriptase zinc-binding domain-containing protein [Tanacetum coccineum]